MAGKFQAKDKRDHPFYLIDNRLITVFGKQIGPYGIAVYNALAYHARQDGNAWPSYRVLMDETGMSRGSVINAIEALVENGLIKKEPRFNDNGSVTSNLYILVNLPPDPVHKTDGTVHQVNGGVQDVDGPVHDKDDPGTPHERGTVYHVDGDGTPRVPKEEAVKKKQLEEEASEEGIVSADAETPPAACDWTAWLKALCWVCYKHQDLDALSKKDLGALTAEAKRMRDTGYADMDALRSWFQYEWQCDWRWKKDSQRPTPADVRSGLATYAHQRAELAQLTEDNTTHRRPKPTQPTMPANDPWTMTLLDLHSCNPSIAEVMERAQAEVVGEERGIPIWQITLDPADASMLDWLKASGAAVVRRALTVSLRGPVLVDVVLPENAEAVPA